MFRLSISAKIFFTLALFARAYGFQISSNSEKQSTSLNAVKNREKYVPKWKKKLTVAEELAQGGKTIDPAQTGIIGTVPVVFKQGENSVATLAIVGQPISEVASQAGQFIKYGCGKGECGMCESKCNGKWIRPCQAVVPADLAPGEDYVIEIKQVKNKAKKSGRFYSVRSIVMGFYNNVLGMWGFVLTRRQTKANWQERQDYESMLAEKIAAKKAARVAAAEADKMMP